MDIKTINSAYPDDNEVGIQEMSITYVQNPDTNDDPDHYQYLKISTVDVPGCDENDEEPPYYYDISIPNFDDGTEGHWSVESGDELLTIFNDFKERLSKQFKKK